MIDALKSFFQAKAGEGPEPTAAEQDRALRLAAGVLLFEVMRADNRVDDAERTVMRTALQSTFSLAPEETNDIMVEASTLRTLKKLAAQAHGERQTFRQKKAAKRAKAKTA